MVFKRMLFIAVIIIVINAILISPIYAMGNIISSGKNFLQQGQLVNEVIATSALKDTSNFIYNLFLVVAIVLAVGVGTVLGIKFIVSSVEGQAKIKEAVIPYIVGCIVIFAAFPIWSFIVDAGQGSTKTSLTEEGKIYYMHSPTLENDNCKELFITKEELYAKRTDEDYKHQRRQCENCYTITVFDTETYQADRLMWAKCQHCKENGEEIYLQVSLTDLRNNDLDVNKYFIVRCKKCNGYTKVSYEDSYNMARKRSNDYKTETQDYQCFMIYTKIYNIK